MNIFYTNENPFVCAKEHCNIHVNKMLIESAQMLSTAHHILDPTGKYNHLLCKPTHINHPSCLWVRSSSDAYFWTFSLFDSLCAIFAERSRKFHALDNLGDYLFMSPKNIPDANLTLPPQCMPDEYKQTDTTKAYQAYLNAKFVEWKSRPKPLKVEWYGEIPTWYEG